MVLRWFAPHRFGLQESFQLNFKCSLVLDFYNNILPAQNNSDVPFIAANSSSSNGLEITLLGLLLGGDLGGGVVIARIALLDDDAASASATINLR